ncbi:hypothetical protein BSIN_0661 [Burkholderia singularis]|uniref:Uncharacterized protein n=1 Tax=Burkholderia singularis TaxID=1503053 RepID=A0A238H990_9BURK|nr:hypothetical protein BSIN_0661 [Burkholderia singularis]
MLRVERAQHARYIRSSVVVPMRTVGALLRTNRGAPAFVRAAYRCINGCGQSTRA